MSYEIQKKLPTATELLGKFPLSEALNQKVKQDRDEISAIIEGKSDKKIMIIGPCSAWPDTEVLKYYQQLQPVAAKVSDKIKIIGRVYLQKPRTNLGWLGPINQPDPLAPADIEAGLEYCRKMMLDVLELGFPIADEALFTHGGGYFMDLLSWIAIGARSTEDQEHRIFASMIPHPVGMKNPTSGNIGIAVNSLIAAQNSHVFAIDGNQVQTSGNPHAHLILRGGNGQSNTDRDTIVEATTKIKSANLKNPAIVIDASHENCIDPATGKKDALRQPQVMMAVLDQMDQDPEIAKMIKGFMCESFIEDGNQKCAEGVDLVPGKSITDPCLGIEKTIQMLEDLHARL